MRNTITIYGNLGRNIEKVNDSGTLYKSVVAVSVKGKEGPETHWYDIVLFSATGSNASSRFIKGNSVGVTGSPRINTYTGKDGVKRSSFQIYVDEIFPVEFKKKETTSLKDDMSSLKDALITMQTTNSFGQAPSFNEEDIPF